MRGGGTRLGSRQSLSRVGQDTFSVFIYVWEGFFGSSTLGDQIVRGAGRPVVVICCKI